MAPHNLNLPLFFSCMVILCRSSVRSVAQDAIFAAVRPVAAPSAASSQLVAPPTWTAEPASRVVAAGQPVMLAVTLRTPSGAVHGCTLAEAVQLAATVSLARPWWRYENELVLPANALTTAFACEATAYATFTITLTQAGRHVVAVSHRGVAVGTSGVSGGDWVQVVPTAIAAATSSAQWPPSVEHSTPSTFRLLMRDRFANAVPCTGERAAHVAVSLAATTTMPADTATNVKGVVSCVAGAGARVEAEDPAEGLGAEYAWAAWEVAFTVPAAGNWSVAVTWDGEPIDGSGYIFVATGLQAPRSGEGVEVLYFTGRT